jgi:hypothetical protein
MVCLLPPQLQSPSGVQELVRGRPPRLNELNQQEMTPAATPGHTTLRPSCP